MISLLLALSLASAAPEVAASPTATDADKPAKPVKPRKICQKIEMTGSSVPKRVCRTVSEPAKPVGDVTQAATEKPAADNMN